MLQNLRVLMTLVVLERLQFLVVNFVIFFYRFLDFLWRIMFSCHTSSGLQSSVSVWKEEEWKSWFLRCFCSGVLFPVWIFSLFQHCTFNLIFSLFIGYQCSLLFFNGVLKVWTSPLVCEVRHCSVRTMMWGFCVGRSGGCCSSGARLPLLHCFYFSSPDIFNDTFI